MKPIRTQNELAREVGISPAHLSEIISRKKRGSWDVAKRLSSVIGNDPAIWMDGSADELRCVVRKFLGKRINGDCARAA
ncbi:MAG: helix-turn-helix transcriptional regulator [Desulfobacterales bacterium]